MLDFAYENGNDIIICVNDKIIGGVKEAVFGNENTCYAISEFLNDVPIKNIEKPNYKIQLSGVDAKNVKIFENGSADKVCVKSADKTVIYSGCFTDSVITTVMPNKKIEYTVKITAAERSEINAD